ncbi:MAG TPA: copper resistance CopC family protein [Actinomycetales bacterium]|nr:copper resistance CopC family protein [Actinomycetales bacterium]
MHRPVRLARRALPLIAAAALVVGVAGPAIAEQVLVKVVPGNGESVTRTPDEVVLTFAEPLTDATVTTSVVTPSGSEDVRPQLNGNDVTIPVPDAGPGQYVVRYQVTPGQARGETGFTVLAAGEKPPPAPGPPSAWWLVGGAVLIGGIGLVVVRMVRLWRDR